jgi:hypothetical protein
MTDGRRRRGGGLAFIHSNELSVRPLKISLSHTSFELQLVGMQVGKTLVKVANIYRPPSTSKSTFVDEFADLLSDIATGVNDRLVICGDFNMPGGDATKVDDRLTSLLDTQGYQQHVNVPTRRSGRSDNLLDLLISPLSTSPLQLLSNVEVRSSYHLSDHELVTCNISVWRHKPPAVRYVYRLS